MFRVPYNIRGQLVTSISREEISLANAQIIREETEASRVDFEERTMLLRSLRLARDVDLEGKISIGKVRPHAAPGASKGGASC